MGRDGKTGDGRMRECVSKKKGGGAHSWEKGNSLESMVKGGKRYRGGLRNFERGGGWCYSKCGGVFPYEIQNSAKIFKSAPGDLFQILY